MGIRARGNRHALLAHLRKGGQHDHHKHHAAGSQQNGGGEEEKLHQSRHQRRGGDAEGCGPVAILLLDVYKRQGFYYVNTGSGIIQCRARGKFRKEGMSPLVGDWVEIQELGGGEGVVQTIEPRTSQFQRPAAANVDQLVDVYKRQIILSSPTPPCWTRP